jgi:hypothetical protein
MSDESVVDLFISQNRRPAPKAATSKSICTHPQLVTAAAVPMFIAFREGRSITKDELVDHLLEQFDRYTRNGCKKVLADALGGCEDGANTWQTRDRKTILRVCENVANVLAVIPKTEHDRIARACQFEDAVALTQFGKTLPAAE